MLITLAIIGIIATLTVPTLMNKYQNHVYETALKNTYSSLSNKFKMAMISSGCQNLRCLGIRPGYGVSNPKIYDEFFLNNISNTKKITGSELSKIYQTKVKLFDDTYSIIDNLDSGRYIYYKIDNKLFGCWDYGNLYCETETPCLLCTFTTQEDTSKLKYSRNFFHVLVLSDGNLSPVKPYSGEYKQYCDPKNQQPDDTFGLYDSCLSRIIQNGWKIDY